MRTLALAAFCVAVVGHGQDDLPVPKDLESPMVAKGAASDFLKTFARTKQLSESAEGRHAALITLETLPDTRTYLGSPVSKILRSDLKRLLLEDLLAAAWVDKT